MSSYFDVLSWTRARKNREALEKTNPQNPVLNDDDEEFLQRITSQEAPAPPLPTIEPTVIDDEGNEKQADVSQKEAAEMILPASPGEQSEKRTWASYIPNVGVPSVPAIPAMPSLASLRGRKADAKVDEKEAAKSEDSEAKTEVPTTDEKKSYSQVAVESSTQDDKNDVADQVAETAQVAKDSTLETTQTAKETALETKDELAKDTTPGPEAEANKEAEEAPKDDIKSELESESTEKTSDSTEKTTDATDKKSGEPSQRTWASYIPSVPTFSRNTQTQESAEAAAASQTAEAKEQDEREVSVLLDRLNLSAINNRVFSFSDQSQKLYAEFTLILKDIVNGAPTAWEDLETLLKENEKHLEQTFKNMPPFVQTLVKSLPAKFATSMGPELMAMAGDKPGNDLKKQMEAASSTSSSLGAQNINVDLKKKQKRKVPNIKDLAKQKGTVTSMLTNIVNFLKLRFPAFVTGTNVVMSLAVFILLFVFWYCRKRGKETRLLRESESARYSAEASELETSSSEDEEDEKTDPDAKQAEKDAEVDEPQSDEEDIKIANAKAYAAAMNRSAVGGPDNAAALRAKKILEG